jgi:hypothetical protein
LGVDLAAVMSATVPCPVPDKQEIANWAHLFSDERFRPGRTHPQVYSDLNFIREYCRLGFEKFVTNSVDEALLQMFAVAARNDMPALIGAPFTPCHWGSLAALLHLFRDNNHELSDDRTVYWLTTERGERSMFAKLRIQSRMRRVLEAVNVFHSPEDYDPACEGTSLVFLRDVNQLSQVRAGSTLIVSDPRGELVFRKGEARALLDRLVGTGCLVTLIVPSAKITYGLAPGTMCWPWNEAALAIAHIRKEHYQDGIPWKWEAAAKNAGHTERAVLSLDGTNALEEPLLQLKGLAYKLFTKPKNIKDLIKRTEFQRLVGIFRQLVVPCEDFDRGDDERRLSARLQRLADTCEGCSKEVAEEIEIGLLFARELMAHLYHSEGKWALLRARVDSCIAEKRPLYLAFPQADEFTAERTLQVVRDYAKAKGEPLKVSVLDGPDSLSDCIGEVVLAGVPKLAMASRWRAPFKGRLTILAWRFDSFFAEISLHESNVSAESVRRRTWSRFFVTPLDSHAGTVADVSSVDEDSRRLEIEEVDGEIEAFDPSYRGATTSAQTLTANVIRKRNEYLLILDDGTTLPASASERQHILLEGYAGATVKTKMTSDLKKGDRIVLIDGESYDELSKRLQDEVDRQSSRLSFNELFDDWKLLCLEMNDGHEVRESFIQRLRGFGCTRDQQTIMTWLRWKVWGPAEVEDIVAAALAADNYDLVRNAKVFWEGLEDQRSRHRALGKWLTRAIKARGAAINPKDFEQMVDSSLELTLGDLKQGVSVKAIVDVVKPEAAGDDA